MLLQGPCHDMPAWFAAQLDVANQMVYRHTGYSKPLHISASLRLVVGFAVKTQGSVLLFGVSSQTKLCSQLTWNSTCQRQWQQPLFLCQEGQQVVEVWNSPKGASGPY